MLELVLIAIGVSMDATAVSIAQGLRLQRAERLRALVMAFLFGLFQALMPLLGALIGTGAMGWMREVDHWVAFALLLLIGGHMLWEARTIGDSDEEAGRRVSRRFAVRRLLTLSVATSIDAFGVGFSLAVMDLPVRLWQACLLIGCCTFLCSLIAVFGGRWLGRLSGRFAELLGGLILIGIGVNILAQHLTA